MRVWRLDTLLLSYKGMLDFRPPFQEYFFFSNSFPPPQEKIPILYKTGVPSVVQTFVSCFDFNDALDHFAAIFSSFEMSWISGSMDTPKNVKQKRLTSRHEKSKPIFLAFAPSNVQVESTSNVLYTVFEDGVTVWVCGKGTEHKCPLKFRGSINCVALSESGALVVANASGSQVAVVGSLSSLAVCDPTKPEHCHLIEVDSPPKSGLICFKNYMVLISRHESRESQFFIQCYDTENHIRALGRAQEQVSNCQNVVAGQNGLYFICRPTTPTGTGETVNPNKVTLLTEVGLHKKLEVLMSREFYDVAKRVVEGTPSMDVTLYMNIRKRYGDFLYSKGSFEAAMTEYIGTIGFLEPSYVIRKYLETVNLPQLARYLEELHCKRDTKSFSTVNHTTLLLNTYIKQNDEAKLQNFIHRNDVRFDPHNVIAICRQGGFYDAALYVADRYAQTHDYVRIKVRDLHQPQEALTFLQTLCADDAEYILRSMGNELVNIEPKKTTQLIIDLCVHWSGPRRRLTNDESLPPDRSEPSMFIHIFVDSPLSLLNFLRAVVASGVLETRNEETSNLYRSTFNTLYELYISEKVPSSIGVPTEERGEDFEEEQYEERLHQAMTFLGAYNGYYDNYVALSLSHQHKFEKGYLFLLDKLELTDQAISFLLQKYETTPADDTVGKILQMCSSGNKSDADLKETWMELLRGMTNTGTPNLHNIEIVLHYIQEKDILPPVTVLEILNSSAARTIPLVSVKEFCVRHLKKRMAAIDAYRAETVEKSSRVEEVRKSIAKLQTSTVVFSSTQCTHCKESLDFPVVHFMCQHSYHQRCLHVPSECNVCIQEQRRVLEEIKDRKRLVQQPIAEAAESGQEDVYTTCARYLSVDVDAPTIVAGNGIPPTTTAFVREEDFETW
ncbi:hypothetical protein AGDE_08549 [Angomonas deanei]|nr:hypothetical protein AGDE_08549 [Angomonas deanei]|eukprot:EPY32584.1 hypothetical protein AGDE_08549 [Angomonas deanei]